MPDLPTRSETALADMPPAAPKPGDTYVQSFARGLAVIRSFSERRPRRR